MDIRKEKLENIIIRMDNSFNRIDYSYNRLIKNMDFRFRCMMGTLIFMNIIVWAQIIIIYLDL